MENATRALVIGLPFKSVTSALAVSGVALDKALLAFAPLSKESVIFAPAACAALIS